MTNDINNIFRSTIREPLVYHASDELGEPVESVSGAVDSIFPTLYRALALKGGTETGARDILEYLSANNINDGILRDFPAALDNGPSLETLKANGADILHFLFHDRVSPLIDEVAGQYALRSASAGELLKVVATLLMTAVSRVVARHDLDAGNLKKMFESEKALEFPSSEEQISGMASPPDHSPPVHHASGTLDVPPETPEDNRSTLSKLLPWIVLLIAALGLFYFLDKGGATPVD